MNERPQDFRINYQSPLAKGLVFAGLGRHPKSIRYTDSSLFKSAGTLTNMVPNEDWVWVPELGRWALDFVLATSQRIDATIPVLVPPLTLGCYTRASGGYDAFGRILLGVRIGTSWCGYFGHRADRQLHFYWYNTASGLYVYKRAAWDSSPAGLHHAAVTWDGTATKNGVTIYANGVALAEDANSSDGSGTRREGGVITLGSIDTSWHYTGRISDPLIHSRILAPAEIQQLADPSNTMLSGLIEPPRRKWWPVSAGVTPPAFKAAWAARRSQFIGSGVA